MGKNNKSKSKLVTLSHPLPRRAGREKITRTLRILKGLPNRYLDHLHNPETLRLLAKSNNKAYKILKPIIMLCSSLLLILFWGIGVAAQSLEIYTHKLTQSTASYQLWTNPPSDRVFKSDAVPVEIDSQVKVYAAKNEFEPFQIVIKPASSGDVVINVGDFGAGITIDLYQVKYVNITTATDYMGQTGDNPDPLWPISSGDTIGLTANENTAFHFSIYVPKTTPAGNYSANMQIAGISIPVTLHVFNFSIPDDLHVKSQMNFDHNIILSKYSVPSPGTDPVAYWMYVDKMKQFFIDHRLTSKSPLWSGGLTNQYGAPYTPPIVYDNSGAGSITDTQPELGFEGSAALA